MFHIAAWACYGIAISWFAVSLGNAIDNARLPYHPTPAPRRRWTRPYIVPCLTETEERVSLTLLIIALGLTAGFVIAAFLLAYFG